MHEPARHALERDSLFAGSWQYACHESDLPAPGNAVRFDCAGRSALLLRGTDGGLRAFRNACRHRGARLVDGDPLTGLAYCVDGRVRCPYHGWSYADDGELVEVPDAQQYPGLDRAAHGLAPLQVERWRGLVFVAFERPAATLAELIGSAPDWPDLAPLRRLHEPATQPVAADWKLACEHLLDTAHWCVPRRPRRPHAYAAPRWNEAGPGALTSSTALLEPTTAATWSARTYVRLAHEAGPDDERWLYVWPNLLLTSTPDGVAATQVLPDGAGRCVLRDLRYGVPDAAPGLRRLRYLHERVRRQARAHDLRCLLRTQQGLATLDPATTGPLDATQTGLAWFVARCHVAVPPAPATKPRRAPRRKAPAVTA
jgi:carnitine monooxygenase subunit